MAKTPKDGVTYILNAGHKSILIRVVTAFLWIAGAALIAIAPWILVAMTDLDGNLEPLSARLFLSMFCLVVGLLCTVGMWVYLRLYPTQIALMDDTVILEFVRLIGTRSQAIPIADLSGGKRYAGRWGNYHSRHQVDAPFMTLWVAGWRLPLIIDLKSDFLDENALLRLIRDANMASAGRQKSTG